MTYRPFAHFILPYLERVEGERFKAYQDSGGVWTAGVGHVNGVTSNTVLTQLQVDQDLDQDLGVAQTRLYFVLPEPVILGLSDCQYAALGSFVFNEGARASWGIWSVIKSGDLAGVPAELEKFIYVDGQVSQGLVNRRKADVGLWLGTDPVLKLTS